MTAFHLKPSLSLSRELSSRSIIYFRVQLTLILGSVRSPLRHGRSREETSTCRVVSEKEGKRGEKKKSVRIHRGHMIYIRSLVIKAKCSLACRTQGRKGITLRCFHARIPRKIAKARFARCTEGLQHASVSPSI